METAQGDGIRAGRGGVPRPEELFSADGVCFIAGNWWRLGEIDGSTVAFSRTSRYNYVKYIYQSPDRR
ncbi:hypothetical protein GMD88_10455 [Pseudoflavonifractor sp. BIOML-A6]|nr:MULTISPECIES: hypothetical protein [unclassified Pseudoflavonifractor]MTQ96303.1 hypothetical protein [Pseudoflavonifractor sp. BIOML-A16]MTR06991.1 hypothetical protein [Pseudoflavonifractor sp. BIOML-A15]MTR32132.1 hypothetical protein [Pseudoflavonifractor sp. BIOML-A14]MTR73715.1 hypothetical protein [Pseudoflavonifractor sp. BIOML-A18]MTS65292.1 hypothetical protein [Pseudoflavonifractor sp. BIOML-A5]MTS71088.1 hypothetical protein [Pseudoflavonifractor sp. BIOML-A8]MTS91839.1 hypoth